MNNNIAEKKITLVYKHSQLVSVQSSSYNKALLQELEHSHDNTLKCLNYISNLLDKLKISYEVICRSGLKDHDIIDRFVISVGGDGTLLDASHYCVDSPILGVNSDPKHSIGALCIATQDNFADILDKIYTNKLKASPIQRLAFTHNNKKQKILALNDMLFCHANPAAMSRFSVIFNNSEEAHRASGIWISSAAGSTGGIFSSGSRAYPIEYERALWRIREPYWCDKERPFLLDGSFDNHERLSIRSNMMDGRVYIDGPHLFCDILLGESFTFALADQPLWLFNANSLSEQRDRIIMPRLLFRRLLKDGE